MLFDRLNLKYKLINKKFKIRARYYNPGSGRFLSEDPIGFESGDYNKYRYVENKLMAYKDPFGLDTYGSGFTFSGAYLGGSFSFDAQIVNDDQGNVALVTTVCYGGVSEAGGISFTVTGSTSNASAVIDLRGESFQTGGSLSLPGAPISPSAGGGVATSPNSCGADNQPIQVQNINFGITAGFSFVDLNSSKCETTVKHLFSY